MKLLLITLRGLPAHFLGPYGNRWVETFAFDSLAAAGVVFDRHVSVRPESHAACDVWLSGRSDGSPPALLQELARLGVHRGLIACDARHLPPSMGQDGWDEYAVGLPVIDAIDEAREFLDEPPDGSWLLWLDLDALLPPWELLPQSLEVYFPKEPEKREVEEIYEGDDEEETAPADDPEDIEIDEDAAADYLDMEAEAALEPLPAPPDGDIDRGDDMLFLRVQKTFAAAVTQMDSLLGELLDGLADDVHVMVTSDRGQSLGERGLVGDSRPSLHAETVNVPLVLVGPGCPAGTHVTGLTASVDVAPTIAALAGGAIDGCEGRNLLEMLTEPDAKGHDEVVIRSRGEAAVRTDEWFLRLPEGAAEGMLFAKPSDRFEVNDVRQQEMELAEAMEARAAASITGHEESAK